MASDESCALEGSTEKLRDKGSYARQKGCSEDLHGLKTGDSIGRWAWCSLPPSASALCGLPRVTTQSWGKWRCLRLAFRHLGGMGLMRNEVIEKQVKLHISSVSRDSDLLWVLHKPDPLPTFPISHPHLSTLLSVCLSCTHIP